MPAALPSLLLTRKLALLLTASALVAGCSPSSEDATVPKHTALTPPGPTPEGMVWIPGGEAVMGDNVRPEEAPVHEIAVDGFWMDEHEVTNAQFEAFVKATNYVTTAERVPKPEDFPERIRPYLKAEQLKPGSVVFTPPAVAPPNLDNFLEWWRYVKGANWRHPEGPDSSITGRMDHPVVCVTWRDAEAYAKWAGKSLPTEAEWEYAARGGVGPKKRLTFTWGDNGEDRIKMANTWTGSFPVEDRASDGHRSTSPVKSFPPNEFGLYDMAGNVWEFVADWFHPDYFRTSPKLNPHGPERGYDPNEPDVPKKVIKGGSWLCSPIYCTGYRPGARMFNDPDSSADHTGFRCVIRPTGGAR